LSKELLSEGYQYLLTEKMLCQDPLEQFFAKQRDGTGSNNAPTVAQVLNFNRVHSVTRSIEYDLKTGNTEASKNPTEHSKCEAYAPLKKRHKT
jgi:hypothetical protein